MTEPSHRPSESLRLSRSDAVLAAALVLSVWLLYAQTASFAFIAYDDQPYVYGNPTVRSGWSWAGFRWAFVTFHAANWHPVTWLSHMLDVEWFGLDPGRHHMTNLWLHMMSTVLLFFLFRETTGHRWPSAFVAAVFALHPLHVETVAWISQRKELLAVWFGLMATFGYVRYARTHRRAPYAAAVLGYALALMSKPTAVSLPLLWLLFDRWPLGRLAAEDSHRKRFGLPEPLAEKLPFLAMAGFTAVLTLAAQHRAGAMSGLEAVPFALRSANAAVAAAGYMVKAVWPAGLAAFYPFPQDIPPIRWVPATVLLTGMCLLSAAARRNRPWLFTGWWWYVVSLLPVIGIVQVGSQSMADRYTYLPLVGLSAALAWECRSRLPGRARYRRAAVGVSAALLAVLAAVSWRQIGYWQDGIHLFRRAASVGGDHPRVLTALGLAYLEKGMADTARGHFETALRLDPDHFRAHNNLGVLLLDEGQAEAAERHFLAALRAAPDDARTYTNLALVQKGRGDRRRALGLLGRALRLDPDLAEAHLAAGSLHAENGDAVRAAEHFRRASLLRPDDWKSRNNLGAALMAAGRNPEAVSTLQEALRLRPDDPGLHNNLAVALARTGRPAEAAAHFARALQLKPDYREAAENLERLRTRDAFSKDRRGGVGP